MLFSTSEVTSSSELGHLTLMKIRFEPRSAPVVAHERLVQAVVEEIKPPGFDGLQTGTNHIAH
jgi:hypothetical protein